MDALVEPLLDWYDAHARELPWRGEQATPWSVMVSEFMLQQTPVARVEPVHRQWLETWPWCLFGGLMLGIVVGFYQLAMTVWRQR